MRPKSRWKNDTITTTVTGGMHILPRLPAKTHVGGFNFLVKSSLLQIVLQNFKFEEYHRRHRRHRLRGVRGRNLATKTIVLVIFTDFLAAFSTLELEKRDAAEFVLQKRQLQLQREQGACIFCHACQRKQTARRDRMAWRRYCHW